MKRSLISSSCAELEDYSGNIAKKLLKDLPAVACSESRQKDSQFLSDFGTPLQQTYRHNRSQTTKL